MAAFTASQACALRQPWQKLEITQCETDIRCPPWKLQTGSESSSWTTCEAMQCLEPVTASGGCSQQTQKAALHSTLSLTHSLSPSLSTSLSSKNIISSLLVAAAADAATRYTPLA